ncbi:hypothetical protein X767_31400 [Mesorhizobium sp. LSJC264A00]|nr:hypothetical protein X767_31400 [Mesorhizobium sp. LSJC264A00]
MCSLAIRGGRVYSIDTSQGEIDTDFIVLALGASAPQLARQAGFRLPIYDEGLFDHSASQPRLDPTASLGDRP